MSRPSVRSQLDQYGFSMSLTPSEVASREQCAKKAQKREDRKWTFEAAHSSISSTASHADIKQRCRKVLTSHCNQLCLLHNMQSHREMLPGSCTMPLSTPLGLKNANAGRPVQASADGVDGCVRCSTPTSAVCGILLHHLRNAAGHQRRPRGSYQAD